MDVRMWMVWDVNKRLASSTYAGARRPRSIASAVGRLSQPSSPSLPYPSPPLFYFGSMSSVDLRVELPSYSYSFHIQVQPEWAIQDVKEEIKRVCPGSPQVDGQRVIWRGRFLRDDERVSDVWKVRCIHRYTFVSLTPVCQSADDARIVHLSVHPSAWNGAPPESPSPRIGRASTSSTQGLSQRSMRREARAQVLPQAGYTTGPLAFIVQKHMEAIHALMQGCLPPASTQQVDMSQPRLAAVYGVQAYGWSWPSVFDEEYPTPSDPSAGVKYEQIALE